MMPGGMVNRRAAAPLRGSGSLTATPPSPEPDVNVTVTPLPAILMFPFTVSSRVSVPPGPGTVWVIDNVKVAATASVPVVGPVAVKVPNGAYETGGTETFGKSAAV